MKVNMGFKTIITKIAYLLIPFAILLSCASGGKIAEDQPIRFVVIGNTSPASPFTGHPEKLNYVIKDINENESPVMVIHTGNVVQGGYDWMGINLKDMNRQYKRFNFEKKSFHPILHVMAGEKDRYNGSLELFKKYITPRLYYSFNYGNVHFIILHITDKEQKMSPDQLKWLEKDLKRHRHYEAIFVFSHYPILSRPYTSAPYVDGAMLHELFKQYPVKAVISGNKVKYYEYHKDNIRYITAGCFGFNYEDWHWGFRQYYVAEYGHKKFSFTGKTAKFPRNSYRPKIITRPDEDKK